MFVDRHRIALFDVLQGHVHVTVAQDHPCKIRVDDTGQYADGKRQRKNGERQPQGLAGFPHEVGQFIRPEQPQSFDGKPFSFIHAVENALSQGVEVHPHRAVRIKRAGIRQVIGDLHEQVVEFFRIAPVLAEHLFEVRPFFLVLLDELGFAHAVVIGYKLLIISMVRLGFSEKLRPGALTFGQS